MEREAASGGFRGRGGAWGSAAGEGAGRRGGRGPSWHGATQVWSEQQQQSPRPRQSQPQPHVGVGGGGPPGSQWVGPTSEGSSWASKVGGASASGSSGGKVVRGQGDSKWVEVGRTAPSIPSQPRPQPQLQLQPQPPPPPSVAGIRSGSLLFSAFLFFSFLFSFFCVLIKLGKPSWKIMVLKVVSL